MAAWSPRASRRSAASSRLGRADRDLALGPVADGQRGLPERPDDLPGRAGRGVPQLRPPVEVEHGVLPPAPSRQQLVDGAAAGLGGQRAGRHPQHGHARRDLHVDVAELEVEVRRLGLPVEDDAGVVGRVELGEGQGRAQDRVGPHVAGVDPEGLGQRPADVVPEGVVAHLGEDRGGMAEAGRGDGHVGRRPADRLAERAHLAQGHAHLLCVQIDADASDGQELQGTHLACASSCWSSRSSAPPAIKAVSWSWLISSLAKFPSERPRLRIRKRSPTG